MKQPERMTMRQYRDFLVGLDKPGNPAAAGAAAEKRIEAKCREYLARAIADIRRFSTETRTIYTDGKAFNVRTKEGQWADFIGYWLGTPAGHVTPDGRGIVCGPNNAGRHIHVEVKATKTFRLPIESEPHWAKCADKGSFSGLSFPQQIALLDAYRAGCTAILVWIVRDRMAVWPGSMLHAPQLQSAKALTREHFEVREVERDDFLRVGG